MEFLILVGLAALLFMVGGLRGRLRELDSTLRGMEQRLGYLDALPEALRRATVPAAPIPAPAPLLDPEPLAPPPPPVEQPVSQPARVLPDQVSETPPPQPEGPTPSERPQEPEPEPVQEPESAEASPSEPPASEPPAPPRDYGDFERRFGTQWVVWVGGLALALGGIFLVRYSIEAGLFTPGLRIIFGAILALFLVGLGELARRREIVTGISQINSAHIPSILTAAGTTIAYADVWAAYALYNFLPSGAAFVLLGLVALATLAAALVHGPGLAGLGLVGAYITPVLVGSTQPNYWALYVYLAVVTAAAYALARMRLWRWLAITAACFSLLWMLVGLTLSEQIGPHAFHAVAGFALASAFIVAGFLYGPEAQRGRYDLVSCGILAGYLLGACLLVLANRHDGFAVATLFVLCAATVMVAWRSEAATPAVAAAALLAVLVIAHWSTSDYFVYLHRPGGPLSGLPLVLKVEGLRLHLLFGTGVALLFGAAGYLAQGRVAHPYSAILWAAASVLTPILTLVALNYGVTGFAPSIPFAALALLLAALFAVATEWLNRRTLAPGGAAATAIYACGGVAAVALALAFALERGWLTVALALMVPGIAFIADKRPLPMLRQFCIVLTLLVLARILWDPRIVGDDVGKTPIFNWLLWGYGVPALSFWIGGMILRRRGDDLASRSVDSAAITFTALTAMLEIRHLMNDGDIYRPSAGLGEIGLQTSTALAMTIGMEHVRERTGSIIHNIAAWVFGIGAMFGVLMSIGFNANPLITGEPVGGVFFNTLLLGYGLPAVLMAILARKIRDTRPALVYRIAAVAAIVLALIYLTLEVRTIFHGPVLSGKPVTDAEDYTYSAVWLAFGVALLLAGIALKSQPARFASAAVVILTVVKVFLHDLAGVQGVYKALSFICLGLVLMGIGWLYQRLLFQPRRPDDPPPQQA
jgi:uncharacterized membrane protein